MDTQSVTVEQAVFTSLPTARSDGYQLVAASDGLSSEQRRALSQWGPSHDSLLHEEHESVNFHPLPGGCVAVGLTKLGGIEHSKRGRQIYTQTLVLTAEQLAHFYHNPFSVVEAATRADVWSVEQDIKVPLPTLTLDAGRTGAIDRERMARMADSGEWPCLAALLTCALGDQPLGIVGGADVVRWMAALFDGLPPRLRRHNSFSTNLLFSLRRPFRVVALADDRRQVRRFERQCGGAVFRLDADHSTTPLHPWAETLGALVTTGQWERYAELFEVHECQP